MASPTEGPTSTYEHLYILIHTHIYVHKYLYEHCNFIHVYIYTHIYLIKRQICRYMTIYIYIRICIYIYVCIYIYTYMYIFIYTHMYIFTYTYVDMYICIYVYAYTHVYVYIYTYICICTHILYVCTLLPPKTEAVPGAQGMRPRLRLLCQRGGCRRGHGAGLRQGQTTRFLGFSRVINKYKKQSSEIHTQEVVTRPMQNLQSYMKDLKTNLSPKARTAVVTRRGGKI